MINTTKIFTAETFQAELLDLIENQTVISNRYGHKNFIRIQSQTMSLLVKIERVENITDSVFETFLIIDDEYTNENIFAMQLDKIISEPAELPFAFYLNPANFAEAYYRIKNLIPAVASIQTVHGRQNETLADYYRHKMNRATRPRRASRPYRPIK